MQQYIAEHEEIRSDADRGKMFGVLVVDSTDRLAFLAAYDDYTLKPAGPDSERIVILAKEQLKGV